MARSISNMNQLAFCPWSQYYRGMVNQMTDRVYKTLNFYFTQDYYTGWTPSSYRRTYDFLYSAVKTEARDGRETIQCLKAKGFNVKG